MEPQRPPKRRHYKASWQPIDVPTYCAIKLGKYSTEDQLNHMSSFNKALDRLLQRFSTEDTSCNEEIIFEHPKNRYITYNEMRTLLGFNHIDERISNEVMDTYGQALTDSIAKTDRTISPTLILNTDWIYNGSYSRNQAFTDGSIFPTYASQVIMPIYNDSKWVIIRCKPARNRFFLYDDFYKGPEGRRHRPKEETKTTQQVLQMAKTYMQKKWPEHMANADQAACYTQTIGNHNCPANHQNLRAVCVMHSILMDAPTAHEIQDEKVHVFRQIMSVGGQTRGRIMTLDLRMNKPRK